MGDRYEPHCLGRDFNNGTDQVGDLLGYAYTPKAIAEINALDDYDSFRVKLEGRPHGAIHSAIGGIWCLGRRRTVRIDSQKNSAKKRVSLVFLTLSSCWLVYRPHLLPPPHPDRPPLVALAAGEARHAEHGLRRLQDAGPARRHHVAAGVPGRYPSYAWTRGRSARQGADADGERAACYRY